MYVHGDNVRLLVIVGRGVGCGIREETLLLHGVSLRIIPISKEEEAYDRWRHVVGVSIEYTEAILLAERQRRGR